MYADSYLLRLRTKILPDYFTALFTRCLHVISKVTVQSDPRQWYDDANPYTGLCKLFCHVFLIVCLFHFVFSLFFYFPYAILLCFFQLYLCFILCFWFALFDYKCRTINFLESIVNNEVLFSTITLLNSHSLKHIDFALVYYLDAIKDIKYMIMQEQLQCHITQQFGIHE